jgi:hypothetical protein
MKLVDLHPQDVELDSRRGPEVIFREAKRRQLRRQFAVGLAVVLVVGAAATVASVLASDTGTAPPHAARVPSAHPAGTSGFRWQRVVTASAPSVRVDAPAAYDPITRQLVLIGGARVVQPTTASPAEISTILGDTWVFAHNDWSKMISGPTPPVGTHPDVLAYDPARGALILVTAPAFAHGTTRVTRLSTTWSWTGSHWTELFGSGPHWGTGTAQLGFDVATRQLVFVPHPPGPDAYLPNTYILGGSGWRRQPKPPRLWEMAYDPVTRRLLGESGPGSLWSWTGKRWQLFKRSVVVHGPRRSWSTATYGAFSGQWVTDGAAHEIISFGGDTSLTWLGRTWRAIDARMRPVPVNPQDLTVAYDGAIDGIVAFGGGTGKLIGPRTWLTGGNSTWELLRSR